MTPVIRSNEIIPSVLPSCAQSQRVPTVKNGFKQGMKLEGIDPQHPSMYFVLTVAEVRHTSVSHRLRLFLKESWRARWPLLTTPPLLPSAVQVCGYRLRLHFDGYSDCHDFWVNANSPDIHTAGWCESTGHKLHTPKGQRSHPFEENRFITIFSSTTYYL